MTDLTHDELALVKQSALNIKFTMARAVRTFQTTKDADLKAMLKVRINKLGETAKELVAILDANA